MTNETPDTKDAVIETAEAIGYALATIKAFMEPIGVNRTQCREAIEKLEYVLVGLRSLLNDE